MTVEMVIVPEIVAIASDHGGFQLKTTLVAELETLGFDVLDLGPEEGQSVDYPDYGEKMAQAIRGGKVTRGVLICGSGIGISIAANRFSEVRAALCHDHLTAQLSREHNDANVLVMGERVIGVETAKDCLATFLQTPFAGGRHERRVNKLTALGSQVSS